MSNTTDLSDYTGHIIEVTEFLGKPPQEAFGGDGLRRPVAVRSGPKRWRLLDGSDWPDIADSDAADSEITGWRPVTLSVGDGREEQSTVYVDVVGMRGDRDWTVRYPGATDWMKTPGGYEILKDGERLATHNAGSVYRVYY